MKPFLFAGLVVALAGSAQASGTLLQKRSEFEAAVSGKDLVAFLVSLKIRDDGQITGRAYGMNVSGSWTWQDGYFCRVMQVGSMDYPRNCQTVTYDAPQIVFQADKGTGKQAKLTVK